MHIQKGCVITLSGYARTGKDTIFEGLRDLLGAENVARVAFADDVRAFAHEIYGLPADAAWWEEHKTDLLADIGGYEGLVDLVERAGHAPTLRGLLVHIGMTMRARNPRYWLDRGLSAIKDARRNGAQIVVVTDARFENEVRWVRATYPSAVSLLVHRPGKLPQGSADKAVDEIPAGILDGTLHNDGSPEKLVQDVCAILRDRGVLA